MLSYALFAVLLILVLILHYTDRPEEPKTKYVFWTGGFDSTAVLVRNLLLDNSYVRPIYISDPFVDNTGDKYRRKNVDFERKTMQAIVKQIKRQFPAESGKLLPIWEIERVTYGSFVKENMLELYKNGYSSRPVRQYGAMAQVCHQNNIIAELGIIDDRTDAKSLWRTLYPRVNGYTTPGCGISDSKSEPYFSVYRYFRFPLLHKSKREVLNEAHQFGYANILQMTWSCWYPVNGKPCGQCKMCQARII
jgi:hypothetical protein